MHFTEAIRTCFRKYANFKGRALRSEYWYFTLFTALVSNGIMILSLVGNSAAVYDYSIIFNMLFNLIVIVPTLSAAVRRMHDSGCSGWGLLWWITIIGIPFVLYWLIRRGDAGPNAYGSPMLPERTPAPESTNAPESQASASTTPPPPAPSPSSTTQLESRNGVNMANDLRDTTK